MGREEWHTSVRSEGGRKERRKGRDISVGRERLGGIRGGSLRKIY